MPNARSATLLGSAVGQRLAFEALCLAVGGQRSEFPPGAISASSPFSIHHQDLLSCRCFCQGSFGRLCLLVFWGWIWFLVKMHVDFVQIVGAVLILWLSVNSTSSGISSPPLPSFPQLLTQEYWFLFKTEAFFNLIPMFISWIDCILFFVFFTESATHRRTSTTSADCISTNQCKVRMSCMSWRMSASTVRFVHYRSGRRSFVERPPTQSTRQIRSLLRSSLLIEKSGFLYFLFVVK